MIGRSPAMDDFTFQHLDSWLESAERPEMRDAIRALMLAEYATDPEYWQRQDWPKLRDAAVSQEQYNRIKATADLQLAVDDMREVL